MEAGRWHLAVGEVGEGVGGQLHVHRVPGHQDSLTFYKPQLPLFNDCFFKVYSQVCKARNGKSNTFSTSSNFLEGKIPKIELRQYIFLF